MSINTISSYAPKFQTAKTTRNVSFTGLEKAARNAGNTAGEAAANAAKKFGITGKIAKIFSFFLKGLKNLGQGILHKFKKFLNTHGINVNIGKTNYVVNGKKVSAEEYAEAVKGFHIKPENIKTNRSVTILQKNGKTYVCGKLYKPGYKLPEGVVIRKHSLSINSKKNMSELLEELKKLSEEWE